jgi:hypothetical protein
VGASSADLWRQLSARTQPFEIAGKTILILDEPARSFHAALHAASDGTPSQAAEDLRRASALSDDTWREALRIAEELRAVDAFSAGLWLLPESRPIARRLDVPRNRSVIIELRSVSAPNGAQVIAMLEEAKGLRAKFRIVRSVSRPERVITSGEAPQAPKGSRVGRLARSMGRLLLGIPVWWRVRQEIRNRS